MSLKELKELYKKEHDFDFYKQLEEAHKRRTKNEI